MACAVAFVRSLEAVASARRMSASSPGDHVDLANADAARRERARLVQAQAVDAGEHLDGRKSCTRTPRRASVADPIAKFIEVRSTRP